MLTYLAFVFYRDDGTAVQQRSLVVYFQSMRENEIPRSDVSLDYWSASALRSLPVMLLADAECNVIASSRYIAASGFASDLLDRRADRLGLELSRIATEIIAENSARPHRRLIPPHYMITLVSVPGPENARIVAVLIEHGQSREYLSTAKRSYSLTGREIEILSLLLDGASTVEVAHILHLAETTVQGYVKRLLGKTASRNRASMIAKVLGWRSAQGSRRT